MKKSSSIIQQEITNEMKTSYMDYAMSVIVGRALPDVRDGLKPVHRRILYGMNELGVTPDKPHKKSARIVGEVMGKYHPHGDSSIYEAMVRMAQDFSTRYQLVDGHGNFGSVDGDGAAAMRYTEARMSSYALEMLKDIDKETVTFEDNFDGEEQEPTVLPARFPNLLVNGANGIAVGMSTSIPPHNLSEVVKAIEKLIDNEDTAVEELIKIIKGPDFPTGAMIMGKEGIKEAYRTGRGKVTVRSKVEVENISRGRRQLVVTEIPYQVNKAKLIERIADLVKDKKLEGVSDIRDESSRQGLRVVIELKREANVQIILNRLYKQTQLQDSFSIIMIALVDGEPTLLNLKDILTCYLEHQKDIVTRRTRYDLRKAEARVHILEGLRIALDNIDEIIKIIRTSYDNAKKKLIKRFTLSDIQAQAILDMRLARLQGLEREKIEAEYEELVQKIAYFKQLLADEKMLLLVIKDELVEMRKKYGDKRRTKIALEEEEVEEHEMIEESEAAVVLTHTGNLKRMPAEVYRNQKTARETGSELEKAVVFTSTHNNVILFTNSGKAHQLKVLDIPETKRGGKGTPAAGLIGILKRERIVSMVAALSEGGKEKQLFVVTKQGYIKKMELALLSTSKKAGIVAVGLKERDELLAVKEDTGIYNLILLTKSGKSICFGTEEVKALGRAAAGVHGITLDRGDEVVSLEFAEKGKALFILTNKGKGKRTATKEYKLQIRGGKGLNTYNRNELKNGERIEVVLTVGEDDVVNIADTEGSLYKVYVCELPLLPRSAEGKPLFALEEGVEVSAGAVARIKATIDSPDSSNPLGSPAETEEITVPEEQLESAGLSDTPQVESAEVRDEMDLPDGVDENEEHDGTEEGREGIQLSLLDE